MSHPLASSPSSPKQRVRSFLARGRAASAASSQASPAAGAESAKPTRARTATIAPLSPVQKNLLVVCAPRSARASAHRDLEESQRPRVRLFLTMSPDERLKLVHAARSSHKQLERALTRFDCRTAKASVDADREMILAYIAAKFAPPPIGLIGDGEDASVDADAEQRVVAYQNFNRSVQHAIREAVAALSHMDDET